MLDSITQNIDSGTIISNLLGGIIALSVAIVISRWEANRQAKEQKNNWYRSIHNTVVRIYGSRNIEPLAIGADKNREYGKLYQTYSAQIEEQLPQAPTEDIGLPLYNALQNVQLSCLRYRDESKSITGDEFKLEGYHDVMIDFSLITLYIIEKEISPDIEFLRTLDDDEIKKARNLFEDFKNGSIYEEQNQQVEETMDRFQQLINETETDED